MTTILSHSKFKKHESIFLSTFRHVLCSSHVFELSGWNLISPFLDDLEFSET